MTHDKYKAALEIARATEEDVKELDFGNVFWACGVLAQEAEQLRKERDDALAERNLLAQYVAGFGDPQLKETILAKKVNDDHRHYNSSRSCYSRGTCRESDIGRHIGGYRMTLQRWTEEEKQFAVALCDKGHTFAEIAKFATAKFKRRITRNAISSIIRRSTN